MHTNVHIFQHFLFNKSQVTHQKNNCKTASNSNFNCKIYSRVINKLKANAPTSFRWTWPIRPASISKPSDTVRCPLYLHVRSTTIRTLMEFELNWTGKKNWSMTNCKREGRLHCMLVLKRAPYCHRKKRANQIKWDLSYTGWWTSNSSHYVLTEI